eukprot:SAG31_NODE_179_length_21090_cov_11.862871_14_plen_74_part_00
MNRAVFSKLVARRCHRDERLVPQVERTRRESRGRRSHKAVYIMISIIHVPEDIKNLQVSTFLKNIDLDLNLGY